MLDSLLALIAVVLMVLAIIASLLPVVPGPALVWAIGTIYAVLTNFQQVTGLSIAIMTVLMLIGVTSGWWMQAAGMSAQGSSCLGIFGGLVGGLVGTVLIPVPFLGTLLGLVVGTLIFEYARVGEAAKAARAGSAAITGYVLSIVVEGIISLLILAVFLLSLAV